jgi:hypothetical protein
MGAEKARALADELIGNAINQMDIFNEKSEVLKSSAKFVINRAH